MDMPRPLGNNNTNHHMDNEQTANMVEEEGLTGKQIQEANYLNSLVVEGEPSEYFAKRASLREAYQELCSQFQGESEVGKEESVKLIESLKKSLDDVDRTYQNVGAGGKELAADADTLLSMAKILMAQMQLFQNANAERVVTPEGFANALTLLMTSQPQRRAPCTSGDDNILLKDDIEIDGMGLLAVSDEVQRSSPQTTIASSPPKITLNQWAWFGRQNYGTLTYDVSFNYQSLRPIVSCDHEAGSSVVQKKERVKRKKDAQEDAVVLTTKEMECVDDEVSVAQELDRIRKALKRAWKENPSVDFYSFVMDSSDFGKTVENMFYVSFLVKDGRVRLSIGDNGLPVLLHVSNDERQSLQVDNRLAAVTNQAIVSFNYEMWEEMVKVMNLQESESGTQA